MQGNTHTAPFIFYVSLHPGNVSANSSGYPIVLFSSVNVFQLLRKVATLPQSASDSLFCQYEAFSVCYKHQSTQCSQCIALQFKCKHQNESTHAHTHEHSIPTNTKIMTSSFLLWCSGWFPVVWPLIIPPTDVPCWVCHKFRAILTSYLGVRGVLCLSVCGHLNL